MLQILVWLILTRICLFGFIQTEYKFQNPFGYYDDLVSLRSLQYVLHLPFFSVCFYAFARFSFGMSLSALSPAFTIVCYSVFFPTGFCNFLPPSVFFCSFSFLCVSLSFLSIFHCSLSMSVCTMFCLCMSFLAFFWLFVYHFLSIFKITPNSWVRSRFFLDQMFTRKNRLFVDTTFWSNFV